MKLDQITESTIIESSKRDLLNLHYRIHHTYRLCKLEQSNVDVDMLREKHALVGTEMHKRKIRHSTSLEHAIEAIFC